MGYLQPFQLSQPPPPPPPAPDKSMQQVANPHEDKKTLYVGNLLPGMAEELRGLFEAYGSIESINQPKGKNFMFIHFSKEESAKEAKEELNGTTYGGTTLKIGYGKAETGTTFTQTNQNKTDYQTETNAQENEIIYQHLNQILKDEEKEVNQINQPKENNKKGHRTKEYEVNRVLWVGGLNNNEMKIFSKLTQYGPVDRIRIGINNRCALIEFKNIEDAKRAINEMIHVLFDEDKVKIRYEKDLNFQSKTWFPDMPSHFITKENEPIKPLSIEEEKMIDEKIKKIIDELIPYLDKYGQEFEELVIKKCSSDPHFKFLNQEETLEFHYYLWKVFEFEMKKLNLDTNVVNVIEPIKEDIPPWLMSSDDDSEEKKETSNTMEEIDLSEK
ncbi:nuclear acid binding protein, putative [Entamoeba dispar SAW760]|uniref:Nuclear acid binding protein, putative n=1 Tax=Entamoeba dispar (strain ATCC PRA-260 / SAW760) TaxID=370354 RepID=B0EPQ8_ENTDS|nr:nuclear acid binding protein, putative [Entamoeba dispar SAW760]EDR23488.1 nuclear acid binding protein, putative [Entamoeba dispar SAW760]|eukprot:EDR23488.1 nuclear acid binding protein, putative [Entamoeba dispar SAW760]